MTNKIHPQLKKAIIESLSMEPKDKILWILKGSKYTRTYGEIIESIENETDEGIKIADSTLKLTIGLLKMDVINRKNKSCKSCHRIIDHNYCPECCPIDFDSLHKVCSKCKYFETCFEK